MVLNGLAIRRAATMYALLFDNIWETASPVYKRFCNDTMSTGEAEEYLFGAGAPGMREWKGDREVHPAAAFAINVRNREWEQTMGIPRPKFRDDKLGTFKKDVEQMTVAAAMHPDELMAELLVGGFDELAYDDAPFFSDEHPLLIGGTQSNIVDGALSAETFEEAYAKLTKMQSPRGRRIKPLRSGGKLALTVGPDLRSTAERIVNVQNDAAGATNPNYGKAEVVVLEELADEPTKWFLGLMDSSLAPLIFQVREKVQFVAIDQIADELVFTKNEVQFGVQGSYSMAHGLYQTIIGSEGE